MDWEPIALIVVSYVLGCLNAGYYVVRWRMGADVRTLGTGTAGARNVGRQLGRSWFIVTLLIDVAKGVAAVALARMLGVDAVWQTVAMVAVVAGHIWPAQLGFRGGKGLATASGAMLVFDPLLFGGAAALAAILASATRRLTVSGMAGVAAVPVLGLALGRSGTTVFGLTALSGVVLFTHRANIIQQFSAEQRTQTTQNALSSVAREAQRDDEHRSDLQSRD